MFHITVGCAPEPKLLLAHDVRILKAALLYADRVKLCSLSTSLILMILALGNLKPEQQLEFLEAVLPLRETDPKRADENLSNFRYLRELSKKRYLNKRELAARMEFKKTLRQMWGQLRIDLEKWALDAGAQGIAQAYDTGLVEFHVFGGSEGIDVKNSGKVVTEYLDIVGKAVSDGTTFPLFDDETGNLVRVGVSEGSIAVTDVDTARGRNVALATYLFHRLPLFDRASVGEIIQIRSELANPLIRFRSAMFRFSEAMKTAAWDENFAKEAETVFYREVEPAVLEIEETINANKYLLELGRKLLDKPVLPASGSVLAFAVSQLSSFSALASIALAGTAYVTTAAFDAVLEQKETQEAAERNFLFFYYKTGEKLSKLHEK